MSYTTVSKLQQLSKASLQNSDYLLISSGSKSYKINLEDMKVFMTEQFVLEDWVIENKVIDSITNTIHATAVQYKVKAAEDLERGDIVTMCFFQDENLNEPIVRKCNQTQYPITPAIGIMYENLYQGEEGAMITIGIFKNINTSQWVRGQELYTGVNGKFTSEKPPVGYIQQKSALVLSVHETEGDILVLFGPPEQQAQDISYNNSISGLLSNTVSTALDEIFQKCDQELVTLDRILIENNEIQLTQPIQGNGVFNTALIWEDQNTNIVEEYTYEQGEFYDKFIFDNSDNLNGKYATISYMAIKIKD